MFFRLSCSKISIQHTPNTPNTQSLISTLEAHTLGEEPRVQIARLPLAPLQQQENLNLTSLSDSPITLVPTTNSSSKPKSKIKSTAKRPSVPRVENLTKQEKFLKLLPAESFEVTETKIKNFFVETLLNSSAIVATTDNFIRIKLICPISGYKLTDGYCVRFEHLQEGSSANPNSSQDPKINTNFQPLSGRGLLDLQKSVNNKKARTRHEKNFRNFLDNFELPKVCPLNKFPGKVLTSNFFNQVLSEATESETQNPEYLDISYTDEGNLSYKFLSSHQVLSSVNDDLNKTVIDLEESCWQGFSQSQGKIGPASGLKIKSEVVSQ